MDVRGVSLLRWSIDARRLAEWRRDTTDQSAQSAIDLLMFPPEPDLFG